MFRSGIESGPDNALFSRIVLAGSRRVGSDRRGRGLADRVEVMVANLGQGKLTANMFVGLE